MPRKLMTSALALTAALAFGAIPVVASAHDSEPLHPSSITDSYNDNSQATATATDSFNDNSTYDKTVNTTDSFNDNSTHDSNDNNSKSLSVADSFNDNSQTDSNNDNSSQTDSFNDNSKNLDVAITDSLNNSSTNDSYNATDSYNDNSDNSTANWNVRVSLSLQDLDASVSGIDFTAGSDHHDGGSINTGNISNDGGAFAGFAGIQTVSSNTGFAANNQAATAISANANVTFGSGG